MSLKRHEQGRARAAAARGEAAPRMRYQNDGDPKTSGPGFGFTVHQDKLDHPPRFPAGSRVFVNSMSDVFHEEASIEAIHALWSVFAAQPDVVFMVLTKRAERMVDVMDQLTPDCEGPGEYGGGCRGCMACDPPEGWVWPLPNVWLGVTIENRRFVHRADLLREAPAAVRFISAEPLLGPVIAPHRLAVPPVDETGSEDPDDYEVVPFWDDQPGPGGPAELDLAGIDWLIAGGESGPRHRPVRIEWIRELRDACQESGTAFFFKQWGGRMPKAGGRELDGRTWDEFPAGRVEAIAA